MWSVALTERRPDPGRQLLPGVHGPGHDQRGDAGRDPASRVLPARPGQRLRQPGAIRIDSSSQVTYGLNGSGIETVSAGLDDVAFQNPDGSYVLVVYNNNSAAPITFAVDEGGRYFTYSLPNNAMTTFVWH